MKIYTADFETTVDENPQLQTQTEVWAWGCSQLFDNTEHVEIGNSIESFFEYLLTLDKHIICFFHNLRFDGSFILSYLLNDLKLKTAFDAQAEKFDKNKDLKNGCFVYSITDMGIWYGVTVKIKGHLIEFRDSLKLLPFSVAELGDAFKTKHRKLNIEYKGERHAHGVITEQERAYQTNDVLVCKEALEAFLKTMHYEKKPPITIGSACMKEFKKTLSDTDYKLYFPNLAEVALNPLIYGYSNADEYIRHSYNGGWCYADIRHLNALQGKTKNNPNLRIKVYDVNSLYTSMQRDNKNRFPVGLPTFFKSRSEAKRDKNKYFFFRFRCNFELKNGFLPFIQIKNSPFYRRNENLVSSYWDRFGNYNEDIRPEMVMSETLFDMFKVAYDLSDFEFLDGCWFETETGLFDKFIDKFFKMKEDATKEGNKVVRTIAKLFLNNLY